ncbi:MauE/DoxX family redox-associated membrane protein [Pedobacter sp. KLB.chiD]|uniref:MauE/DoxX family redox-associated membrane protein n=1 Tax=Pedobacter sp. KLB.chiD TaxID=3387402 RepID=UPI00399A2704
MKTNLSIWTKVVSYLYILLFTYASVSKILDFENFQVQVAQSPVLSAYADFIPHSVIIIELLTVLLICFERTRIYGMFLSFWLMVAFSVYIYIIINYSDFVPCSCGGILEKMGWTTHLIFNLVCVVAAAAAIIMLKRKRETNLIGTYATMVIITVCASFTIVILFLSSEHVIKKENNFTRRFLLHPVIEDKKLDLQLNSFYFAGADDSNIYLGNVTAPLLFTKLDTGLHSVASMRVRLDRSDYKYRNLQLKVKSPYYYLYDGNVPVIYRGHIKDSIVSTISHNDAYFTQLAVIDTGRFAIRTQSRVNKEYTLAFLDLADPKKIYLKPDILEKQIDGVFDSDGKLIANHTNNQFAYTYTYRNQFIIMDSNLNVLRRLNTIDTTSLAKVSSTELSDGRHKMNAPPLKVNVNCVLAGNLLFNESNLMGKNESRASWQKASIVDVYRTDQKEYIGSFYIYHKNKQKMRGMLATDQYLYVLLGNDIIRYHFRDNITKEL